MPLGLPHSRFLSWLEDDQDKALAWNKLRASTCSGCGTRGDEWEEDEFAYVGHHWRCKGCDILEQERDNIPEGERGIHVGIIPKTLAEALEEAE